MSKRSEKHFKELIRAIEGSKKEDYYFSTHFSMNNGEINIFCKDLDNYYVPDLKPTEDTVCQWDINLLPDGTWFLA